VHVDQATENILRIFEVYHKAVSSKSKTPSDLGHHPLPPVYKGEAQPLRKKLEIATHVHGNDGLGNSSLLKNDKGKDPNKVNEIVLETQ
jgi:inosine-uridine nucleoside N-ribohydrolase